jgi:hypothetical protein
MEAGTIKRDTTAVQEEKSHDEPEPIAPIRKNRPGEPLLRSDLLLTVMSCAGRHFHVSISSKRRTEGFAQYPPARCASLIRLEAGGLIAAGVVKRETGNEE